MVPPIAGPPWRVRPAPRCTVPRLVGCPSWLAGPWSGVLVSLLMMSSHADCSRLMPSYCWCSTRPPATSRYTAMVAVGLAFLLRSLFSCVSFEGLLLVIPPRTSVPPDSCDLRQQPCRTRWTSANLAGFQGSLFIPGHMYRVDGKAGWFGSLSFWFTYIQRTEQATNHKLEHNVAQ
jgi:hypothetical protein